MKLLFLLLFMFSVSYAKVYYAKVEPYEVRNISSNVSGLVLFTDEDKIGEKLSSKPYIQIDDELDIKDLAFTNDKLRYLKNTLLFTESSLGNLNVSLKKKRENYKKVASLKIKSDVEKDREFHDLINSENQFLSTKKELQNLKIQIADLKFKLDRLKRTVDDKSLNADGFVLYSISVKVGQVVGISTPLAKVADTSKAKLTIYLDGVDVVDAKNRVVYIDGKKTDYKISRILNIADSKNISKYMAVIITKSPDLFSKLVKIELRDE